ncbi:MAG: monoamine oxidase [Myxococcota bacterium]|jgi:monoamine oxidase
MPEETTLDVAVIGGGVSGVYSAWRLKTAQPQLRVAVFEGSDRVGGRLLSARPPGIPNLRAELGGMRYLTSQPIVTALIQDVFKIQQYDFPVSESNNIAYLRGEWLRDVDLTDPAQLPYRLSWQEEGKSAGDVVIDAIDQILPGATSMTDAQRRVAVRTASFAGRPLWQQGFWQVLYRVMSSEAYAFAKDAGGYDTTLANWNAADAIPWYLSDFGTDAKYYGLTDGYETLPWDIAEAFTAAGGTLELGAWLAGFDVNADGVRLRFESGEVVNAKRVILAMPRRAIELVAAGAPFLQQKKVAGLLGAVTGQPMFKLWTAYRYPWWSAAGVSQGKSNTDLPIRQCYYWGTVNEAGGPAANTNSLLQASYDDGTNAGFWDGLRPRRGRNRAAKGHHEWFEGELCDAEQSEAGDRALRNWTSRPAPAAMVAELQRQLATLHDLDFVPRPYTAAFMDWGDDPYGGAWNSWNIGVRSWKVYDRVQRPDPNSPVYVCGEAYSNAQGWVEGALDTAESMLTSHFGLDTPDWLQ